MHVQQIELFRTGDRRHFCCEREVVGLMLKQRIRHHLDLVKMHAVIQFGDAGRQDGRDEVDVVPAFRQFSPKLRPDDAAAAVGRINRDADVHQIIV